MPLRNCRDTRCQEVICFAVFCRIITLLLQALFNLLIPDHAADAFSPPRLSDPGFWDQLLEWFLGGLSRWDAEHFLFIAEHGYVYEHNCAFFPLFPLTLKAVANIIFWPFQGFLCFRSCLLLSAVLLNAVFSVLASWTLYELSCAILRCRRRAFLSAILFCLTPANIFMAAAYSESMFAFLVLAALWRLEKGHHWVSLLLFSLATGVRSNGLINAGFLIYYQAKLFAFSFQASENGLWKKGRFLKLAAALVLMSASVALPFALFQYYAYLKFCHPNIGLGYAIPKLLLQLAESKGYRVAASEGGKPPWCSWNFPVLYTYIQDTYWNVGFLRYFELKQIPNFLLASPVIVLGSWAIWSYVAANPWHCLTLGLVRRKSAGTKDHDSHKPAEGFCSPGVLVYVVHAAALLVFGTFFMHVQVLTRFLGSSSPVLYWFCAHLLCDTEPLLQDGGSPSKHREFLAEKPSVDNFFSTCSRHENPVLMLLSKWKQSRILTKCILGYVLSYWLLGLILHCNFFPWT